MAQPLINTALRKSRGALALNLEEPVPDGGPRQKHNDAKREDAQIMDPPRGPGHVRRLSVDQAPDGRQRSAWPYLPSLSDPAQRGPTAMRSSAPCLRKARSQPRVPRW